MRLSYTGEAELVAWILPPAMTEISKNRSFAKDCGIVGFANL
jgi:hypothetical protein